MAASWSPWWDVAAVIVLGAVGTGSIVWWCRTTRRRARTRPGHVYERRNLHTSRVTYRAVDGAGRRSRRFRTEQAARRWLDRRQGRPAHDGPDEHPIGSLWSCDGCRTWKAQR